MYRVNLAFCGIAFFFFFVFDRDTFLAVVDDLNVFWEQLSSNLFSRSTKLRKPIMFSTDVT